MPPKRSTRDQDGTPGPFVVSNAMPGDGRPHMFKYSSMTGVAGALQMKNMSSGFMKEDRHSYWNRRPANADAVMGTLKAKRRKLYQKGPEDIGYGDEPNENGDVSMNGGKLEDVEEQLADQHAKAEQAREDDNDSDGSDDSDDSAAAERKADAKGKGRDNGRGNLPDPSKVLIVHPGSRTLRIGRSTDAAPLDIPYCIARRMAKEALPSEEVPFSTATSEALDDMKLENLRYDLKARMRVLNLRGTTAGSVAAAEYNSTVTPQTVPDEEDEDPMTWTKVTESSAPDAYFGEEALHLPNPVSHGYKLRYPYRKGNFNTRDYSSLEELLGDIEAIWTYALDKLGIRALDAEQYSVMLLIPDRYAEVYVRNMCELVLKTMGFAQMIVHQEGLSASFAAGLPSACIIDLGAAKTSVSCVDEGFVINDTRMVQSYGGDDVLELFLQVAKTVNFPYKEANLAREYDWELCKRLIEQCCAFNEHNFGVNTFEFLVRRPGQQTLRYNMKLHDEVTLPTYCVWVPRMLDWERKLQPQPLLWRERKGIEDPIDIGGDAVTAAMKQSCAHLEQPRVVRPVETASASLAVPELAAVAAAASPSGTPNPDTKPSADELNGASPAPVQQTGTAAAKGQDQTNGDEEEDAGPTIDYVAESSKLPLEIAVLESLAQCGSEDRLKRIITNILLVGGLGNMQGVGFALQSRLERSVRERFPGIPSPLVIPKAKYADSAHLAWRGLINLCKLEVCNDMWIRKDDWELMNLRALRDRSYFVLP